MSSDVKNRQVKETIIATREQHFAMGYIKAKLKENSSVHVVERSFPSTQECPKCVCLTKHSLDKRVYRCEHCGYTHPSRDIKSARSILDEALKQGSSRIKRRKYL